LTNAALARLPEALAVLFHRNRDALAGFTDEEAAQFCDLLTRFLANLDQLTEARSGRG
jgi:MarR family transcriptional regulator, transcriptional regulator for hemolysin